MRLYKPPFKNVSSDTEPFVVPNLPHEIKLIRKQMSEHERDEIETDFTKLLSQAQESELRSYGTVVNSFYDQRNLVQRHPDLRRPRQVVCLGCNDICKEEKPVSPPYQVSKERAKSLGIHFILLEVSLKDIVENFIEKKFLSF
ncbi:hypothetical protein RJ640_006551 [Escallonia rubra]|uniref:Uncharacterized protein n=1 Tax=Escallonia rubra TaxID=112253 RepID=A0AA88U2Y5_9ASTE|nr:hypothetical protein RJ640_006551 [Escallonia rubra]